MDDRLSSTDRLRFLPSEIDRSRMLNVGGKLKMFDNERTYRQTDRTTDRQRESQTKISRETRQWTKIKNTNKNKQQQ